MALITAAHLTPAINPVFIAGIEPLYVTAQSYAPGTQLNGAQTVIISVEQPNLGLDVDDHYDLCDIGDIQYHAVELADRLPLRARRAFDRPSGQGSITGS